METERSFLGTKSFPRYTFLGSGNLPKEKLGRMQCCVCTTLIILLVVTLVIILSYYLRWIPSGGTSTNSSQELDDLLRLKWPLQEEKYVDFSADLENEMKAFEVGAKGLKEKESIEESFPSLSTDSPSFRHQIATETSKQAQEMSRLGFALNLAAKEFGKCYSNNTDWVRERRRWTFTQSPEWYSRKIWRWNNTIKCTTSPYRTANGICNNLAHPTWGASLHPFRRILLPKYEDDISQPRKTSLPSARDVSQVIHRPFYRNDVNFTVMLAVWGQFIDHDITATAINKGKNGSAIKCCQTTVTHPECFPVVLGPSDPIYLQHNITCMEFVRSAPAPGFAFGPREQLNQATSYLDGSVIYGNDEDVMNQLRTFIGGELKMLKTSVGDLLPVSEDPNDGCNRREEFEQGRYCFMSGSWKKILAIQFRLFLDSLNTPGDWYLKIKLHTEGGDKRSNENLLLTSMHLLFARQHNLIATTLSKLNTHWTDEKLFQETRKIIGAQIQHITFNEFLPSILPEKLMNRLNISTKNLGYFDMYNPVVDATIANVFASAAFRFGHTLLPGLIEFWNKNSSQKEYIELHKMLFNPFNLFETEFLENFMKGAMNTSSAKSDVYFSPEVTQKLFQNKNSYGLDLVSLNIQRGRDHGLPSYPNWRTVCGLKKPKTFQDLQEDIDEDTLNKLSKLYKSVDDLDLYTAGLAEKPVEGGLIGPTITCLIADQFLRLKIGDRYWYEGMEEPQKYTLDQLNEIRKTSLARIICDTSGVNESQPFVMKGVKDTNKLMSCNELSFPDFSLWKEI